MDGGINFSPMNVSEIPISGLNNQAEVINLVERLLAAKHINHAVDTSALEADIDRLVYDLYGLTEEEIKIVEGAEYKTNISKESNPSGYDEHKTNDTSVVTDDPNLPIEIDFGLYKCGVCGKMVMGYEKKNHATDFHKGGEEWSKIK